MMMLKERDIPQATTSARAAAKCDGLGGAAEAGAFGPAGAVGAACSALIGFVETKRRSKTAWQRTKFFACL
jgi:hypothetical protein